MKVVWTLETATVRDVYEHLRARRTIAYTTVLTMMKILEQKGYVTKARHDRAFVYRPARPRQATWYPGGTTAGPLQHETPAKRGGSVNRGARI